MISFDQSQIARPYFQFGNQLQKSNSRLQYSALAGMVLMSLEHIWEHSRDCSFGATGQVIAMVCVYLGVFVYLYMKTMKTLERLQQHLEQLVKALQWCGWLLASNCFLLGYICYICIYCNCYIYINCNCFSIYICYICICGSNSHQRTAHSGQIVFFFHLFPRTLWDWIEMFWEKKYLCVCKPTILTQDISSESVLNDSQLYPVSLSSG